MTTVPDLGQTHTSMVVLNNKNQQRQPLTNVPDFGPAHKCGGVKQQKLTKTTIDKCS